MSEKKCKVCGIMFTANRRDHAVCKPKCGAINGAFQQALKNYPTFLQELARELGKTIPKIK